MIVTLFVYAGAQMILMMKVISVGFDLDQGTLFSLPDPLEYFGYTFCVGTSIFGPWVSFTSYMTMLQPHQPVRLRAFIAPKITFSDLFTHGSGTIVIFSTLVNEWQVRMNERNLRTTEVLCVLCVT